jgi:hypothetical protein
MQHSTVQALGQARLAELHRQPSATRWPGPPARPAAGRRGPGIAQAASWPWSPPGPDTRGQRPGARSDTREGTLTRRGNPSPRVLRDQTSFTGPAVEDERPPRAGDRDAGRPASPGPWKERPTAHRSPSCRCWCSLVRPACPARSSCSGSCAWPCAWRTAWESLPCSRTRHCSPSFPPSTMSMSSMTMSSTPVWTSRSSPRWRQRGCRPTPRRALPPPLRCR